MPSTDVVILAGARMGHPLGATGTRLVLTRLYELRRRGLRYGLATACMEAGRAWP